MTQSLAARVSGPVYTPNDAGYAPESAGFNVLVTHSPQYVVAVKSTKDVAEAIRFARENQLPVSVQATGHGTYAPVTSGVLLSTKALNHVSIDPATRIATIGAGARWEPVIEEAAKHGLTPIAGSSTNVGVVGYLLGGGLGPLVRSHGVSSDYVVGYTLVTSDGETVEASAEHHPDLFWGLRGGKGGFGIVTEVKLQLVEMRSLYAGSLFFAEEHIEAVLRGWVKWTSEADARVSTSIAVMRFPPFDFIPPPLQGRTVINLRFAFPGSTEEGAKLAAPLRALAPLYMDMLGELPVTQIARIHNDPDKPSPVWTHGMMLTHVDQDLATTLLRHVGAGVQTPYFLLELRHLGGACQKDVAGGSAVGGRGGNFVVGLVGMHPPLFETVLPGATEGLRAELKPWLSPEMTINFMGKVHSAEHFDSAWPDAIRAKLKEVRGKYDPHKLFAK
ncbi:FAD-dependent oxidoreductase [Corallococcus exiguus]|uniref:FAD-binding oxidoreductase n=1 Tax=Corallococcus TaxID=83461 RepID=UPI000EE6A386|nr:MULTISPECIES: FAD-dependent oxidoreductase [Corallococcus]NNB91219.1 FAD-dependent oxidoreductase [Corallococcus exiguus]NNB99294.1 FAD-dependent oxidoreductase [Corallococcus exiguus]NNC08050.1 FAD-dependent oxidoreductase [Corallococcus exiguus]NPC51941.1 FAD-dependent oxidoreductase [Corallococcus exiguus]RKH79792.1 FAD-binding oxidoreductase [Corallococcus sp. AB032C]